MAEFLFIWLTFFWGITSDRIILYAITVFYYWPTHGPREDPISPEEFKVNNHGLDAHQGHSKFEIFRPGKRKLLFFRSWRKKCSFWKTAFIIAGDILEIHHKCWKGNAGKWKVNFPSALFFMIPQEQALSNLWISQCGLTFHFHYKFRAGQATYESKIN